ncbi:hypothetical protein [Paenibacillus sp. KN14-4R]
MRIFKTHHDFVTLRRTGAIPVTLLDQVEGYFQQLKNELEDSEKG